MRPVLVVLMAVMMSPAPAGPPRPPAPVKLTPQELRSLAHDYYQWYYNEFPVAASDAGLHDGDRRLASYSASSREGRSSRAAELLGRLAGAETESWSVDDRVDLALLRADVSRLLFDERVLRRARRDPGLFVDECTNGIFSLLKKDYAPRAARARAATARMESMPALLAQARDTLDEGVPLLARFAWQSIDGVGPLFNESLGVLVEDLDGHDRAALFSARGRALKALEDFGVWLKAKEKVFNAPLAMGRESYDRLLRDVYLLPLDADQLVSIGNIELARARAMESWLSDPTLGDTLKRPPGRPLPSSGEEFREGYEAQTAALMQHLERREIVTIPNYVGPFKIVELPAAFRPTSPGGFMNAPGVFDADPTGFYFLPAFDPRSENFYMRAALSDPRPILGHEGIPGHFLQISIANHNANEIRRLHQDGVFQEGWALYGEEMLLRTGLYEDSPEGQAQVLRLMRYRAARIPVDVRLATGEWTFPQAVEFFMKEGGLDREAATGEAAGAATTPGQKMNYIVGKYQIQRLLGLYRERMGKDFRLRDFHDRLLANGSLPLSIVEWLMMGDDASFRSIRPR